MARVVEIETERLLLRGKRAGDADRWGGLLFDPDFQRFIPVRRSDEAPAARAERNLDALMARWEREPLAAVGWVIARREDGQVIGTGGIDVGEVPEDGEIDYFLGKPFWVNGFGREAARAMARFARERLPFTRLVAYIVRGNIGSIRIAEGMGLRHEREVDYLQFFPDPTAVVLEDSITGVYAARMDALTLGDEAYRIVAE